MFYLPIGMKIRNPLSARPGRRVPFDPKAALSQMANVSKGPHSTPHRFMRIIYAFACLGERAFFLNPLRPSAPATTLAGITAFIEIPVHTPPNNEASGCFLQGL